MEGGEMDLDLNPQSPVIKGPWTVIGHSYSCGIFWKRKKVDWRLPLQLLGRQPSGTMSIDMAQQQGRYRLYKGNKLIHFGATEPDGLGKCLYQCTKNEFAHKWDHFSWLGLCPVNRDGSIGPPPKKANMDRLLSLIVAWTAYNDVGCGYWKVDIANAKLVRFKQVPTS